MSVVDKAFTVETSRQSIAAWGRVLGRPIVFFVTVRPWCLSSSTLSSALGIDLVGTGLSCHLRCGVLGVFPITFWCSSLSSLSILEELNELV